MTICWCSGSFVIALNRMSFGKLAHAVKDGEATTAFRIVELLLINPVLSLA
jgi:hypothetical protein